MEDIQVLRVGWVVALIGFPSLIALAVSLAGWTARRREAIAFQESTTQIANGASLAADRHRARTLRRSFWCTTAHREVEVEFEATGLPGLR